MLLHIPIMFILQVEENPDPEIILPGVNWENVYRLGNYNTVYINYKQVITRERLPSIFPYPTVVSETCVGLSHDNITSCHMTTSLPVTWHNITSCHIYSILHTVCWRNAYHYITNWGSACVLRRLRTCQTSYASGKGPSRWGHSDKFLCMGQRWPLHTNTWAIGDGSTHLQTQLDKKKICSVPPHS